MKPDDILDAIGNIDDVCVKKAKAKKKSHKAVWITIGSIVACLALVVCMPYVLFFLKGAYDSNPGNAGEEMAVGWDYVRIYYVDGDEIKQQKEWLRLSAEDIFNVWKEKNGLGDDVELIRVIIDSNSKTAVSEFDGEGVVNHEVGNYHIYNLTITKSIENYYDTIDRELMLESLKRTMTGYSGIEYDEYHLILEE